MIELSQENIQRLMLRAAAHIKQHPHCRASLRRSANLYDFFPFSPSEVAGTHTRKTGKGEGVWFRLKDGRVFSQWGHPAPHDPKLYDDGKKLPPRRG